MPDDVPLDPSTKALRARRRVIASAIATLRDNGTAAAAAAIAALEAEDAELADQAERTHESVWAAAYAEYMLSPRESPEPRKRGRRANR